MEEGGATSEYESQLTIRINVNLRDVGAEEKEELEEVDYSNLPDGVIALARLSASLVEFWKENSKDDH